MDIELIRKVLEGKKFVAVAITVNGDQIQISGTARTEKGSPNVAPVNVMCSADDIDKALDGVFESLKSEKKAVKKSVKKEEEGITAKKEEENAGKEEVQNVKEESTEEAVACAAGTDSSEDEWE